jgi:hypothetical protein
MFVFYQGRRAPLRFALAPGCYFPRRWRCIVGYRRTRKELLIGQY